MAHILDKRQVTSTTSSITTTVSSELTTIYLATTIDSSPSNSANPAAASSSVSTSSATATTSAATDTSSNNRIPVVPVATPVSGSSSTLSSPQSASTASTITSSAASQTTTSTHKSAKSANTISTGEAAGIGIGSAIAGALLTFLFFCIFMKRSNRSKHGKYRHSRDVDIEKPLPRTEIVLDENLIERADDSQIRKSMLELNELIDQHVENYYDLKGFEGSPGGLELRLVECGFGTDLPISAGQIVSILKNPKTRFAGIRHLIVSIIVKNIGYKAGIEFSLLSPKISTFFQSMPPVERQPGCEEVFDKAFTKWRQISAFLLSPTRSSRDAPQASERELQNAINQNVALINSVLLPFIKPGEMQRYQEDNLRAIIFQGAQLGLLLFCQPSTWVFGWKASSREENGRGKDGSQVTTSDLSGARLWVVFPGIAERVERHGRQKVREVVSPVAIDI